MNLAKIILMQKDLDEVINKNHPIQKKEDRTAEKVTALVVELAEFANEARFFKYWSEDQEPRTLVNTCEWCISEGHDSCCGCSGELHEDLVLGEYVDSLHFFVSVALDKDWEKALYIPEERFIRIEEEGFPGGLTEAFNGAIYHLMKSQYEGNAKYKGEHYRSSESFFNEAWFLFMAIGLVAYGYSEEDIEDAYVKKNLVNHERQNTNY